MPTEDQLDSMWYTPQLIPTTISHNLARLLDTAVAEIQTQLPADLKAQGVSYQNLYSTAIASVNKIPPSDADLYEQIQIAIKPARKLFEEEKSKSLAYAPRTRLALFTYLQDLRSLALQDLQEKGAQAPLSLERLVGKEGVLAPITLDLMPKWFKPLVITLSVTGLSFGIWSLYNNWSKQ